MPQEQITHCLAGLDARPAGRAVPLLPLHLDLAAADADERCILKPREQVAVHALDHRVQVRVRWAGEAGCRRLPVGHRGLGVPEQLVRLGQGLQRGDELHMIASGLCHDALAVLPAEGALVCTVGEGGEGEEVVALDAQRVHLEP